MSFMLYFYHGINYLGTASDLDTLCSEEIVAQWMCMEDEGSHIYWDGNRMVACG